MINQINAPFLLQIKGLTVVFETYHGLVHALSGVDLSLANGKITGLVGETGCGKSVTAKSVMRLITKPGKITSGQILFDGEDLLQKPMSRMQDIRGKKIAMIFQNPRAALNPVFTIKDQIYFILERHQGLSKKQSNAKALELLKAVEIPDPKKRLENYPFELSTGMCQRIMIAMALSCRPQLLIADEPTTGLDVTLQAQILDLFAELVYEFGSTAMIITHDLGVVAETCDYTAVMYAGKVVEYGYTENVFSKPLHPYSQGLLKSSFVDEDDTELYYIPGTVPDLLKHPTGCLFAARCFAKRDLCEQIPPPLAAFDNEHRVLCHAAEAYAQGHAWESYEWTFRKSKSRS